MSTTITVLHVQGHPPEAVEVALDATFAAEERTRILRLEGTFAAVLARVRAVDAEASATHSYLICRPYSASPNALLWTPVLELGERSAGLDLELSRRLGGAAVFTTFLYGDGLSGYRLVRDGQAIDRYASDPTYFEGQDGAEDDEPDATGASVASSDVATDVEAERGHPERFADLLPGDTQPEDFARVVLRPGWWELHDAPAADMFGDGDEQHDDIVDEADRMRCIGLALELWGPSEYPFAQEPEEIANKLVGPALALAYT